MDDIQSFLAPLTVSIARSRWTVVITVVDSDGAMHTYIASADHGDTDGDGIWFGTKEEYDARGRW